MPTVLWLQGQACSGDTISFLNAEHPDVPTTLTSLGLEILWHPSLSPQFGDEVGELLMSILKGARDLDVLVVEGAVPRGPEGTGKYFMFCGRPFQDWIKDLAPRAGYVLAAGTCAAYGGVSAADRNPTDSTGLQWLREEKGGLLGEWFRSRAGLPVINAAGCPAHPSWITETLIALVEGRFGEDSLDEFNRPAEFYTTLAHHACPRNEYYEFKASAEEYGQGGCLFEHLGCKGTRCLSDCNLRLWLGRTGSCTRAGFPCIVCAEPGFPERYKPYFATEKIAGIPTTLPADVKKAWYVGLAGLTRAATPERLRKGATSHKVFRSQEGKK